MKNILGYAWFSCASTSINTIGIVIYENDVRVKKAVIGTAYGYDEKTDIQSIADWGGTFPLEEATTIIDKQGIWIKEEKPKTDWIADVYPKGPAWTGD